MAQSVYGMSKIPRTVGKNLVQSHQARTDRTYKYRSKESGNSNSEEYVVCLLETHYIIQEYTQQYRLMSPFTI